MKALSLAALACALTVPLLLPGRAEAAGTLDTVRARSQLMCGVNTGLSGFSLADSQGVWRGLDADYCRAIAAAVLGDASKVRFVPLTASTRFTALQSGEIDVLLRNSTQTYQLPRGLNDLWNKGGLMYAVPFR